MYMLRIRVLPTQSVSNMASRQKRSSVWLYFTKKDNTRASCNTCIALITSKVENTSNMLKHLTTQHAITLHGCKVLLSDGRNSSRWACGTASSVSKVPGNVKLPGSVDCNRALKSHALSGTVTLLALLSRTSATHCISHAEKKNYNMNFSSALLSLWKRQETSTSHMSLSRAVIDDNNNTNNIIN